MTRDGKVRNRHAASLFSGDDALRSPEESADYASRAFGGLEKVHSAVMPNDARSELAPLAKRAAESSGNLSSLAERHYRDCQQATKDKLMKNQSIIYK